MNKCSLFPTVPICTQSQVFCNIFIRAFNPVTIFGGTSPLITSESSPSFFRSRWVLPWSLQILRLYYRVVELGGTLPALFPDYRILLVAPGSLEIIATNYWYSPYLCLASIVNLPNRPWDLAAISKHFYSYFALVMIRTNSETLILYAIGDSSDVGSTMSPFSGIIFLSVPSTVLE